MTYKRVIPFFLLADKRLVKGTKFGEFIDVGDPVSQGMIYDAQGADEIFIVDINASTEGRLINTDIINTMITKCRLPIVAGGGIKNLDDARKCFEAGADKIVINTSAILNPSLIKELADEFGSQSVVISVDVKKDQNSNYDIYIYSGKQKVDIDIEEYLSKAIDQGAGEIVITSIDNEGTLLGFDYDLYNKVKQVATVPLIASGGAGSYDDLVELFEDTETDAAALGKMLFLRDYDIVRIKAYIKGKKVLLRDS